MVELEVVVLVPLGSNRTGLELEEENVDVALDEVVVVPLELETVPIAFAVPIG
jgi:hypothetical protein